MNYSHLRYAVLEFISRNPGVNGVRLNIELWYKSAFTQHVRLPARIVDRMLGYALLEFCASSNSQGKGLRLTEAGEKKLAEWSTMLKSN